MNIINQLITWILIWIAIDVNDISGINDKRLSRKRHKRAAYELPSGWELLVDNEVIPQFQCVTDGYFADTHNGCQIYHLCQSVPTVYGTPIINQHTFVCPNQTVFDQSLLICNHIDQSIACEMSPDFYYLNTGIGEPSVKFLNDEDMDRRQNYVGLESTGLSFGDRILKGASAAPLIKPIESQQPSPPPESSPIRILSSPAVVEKPLSTAIEPSFDYDYDRTGTTADQFISHKAAHIGNDYGDDDDSDFITVRRLVL